MFIIGSVLICTTVYIGSVWDPSWIRTDVYDILKNIWSVLICTIVYIGSMWDPSWIRTDGYGVLKKKLDPYSLLVRFIWVPYGIHHGSVQRFCRF